MSKALVIGIDNYLGNPLHGCVNDAVEIANLMRRNADGSINMEVDLQVNVAAATPPSTSSRAYLLSLITDLFRGSRYLSLLYFSGHGYVNNMGGFLVTPGAREFDEGIKMDEIIQLANASEAMNRVIILDCCFAGALAEGDAATGINICIKQGVTILAASRKNETAMEAGGHGVFTNLLIQALAGGAADIGGYITPGSIYAYIDQALGETGQRPVFKTNILRFISLRKVKPQVPDEVLQKLIEYFPAFNQEHQLNPSYEYTNTESWVQLKTPPYADEENVKKFKALQKLQSAGLVTPVDSPHMYFAAMEHKTCRLTPLGYHYWRLVKEGKI
jgi:uncharacterized caspase-like protein